MLPIDCSTDDRKLGASRFDAHDEQICGRDEQPARGPVIFSTIRVDNAHRRRFFHQGIGHDAARGLEPLAVAVSPPWHPFSCRFMLLLTLKYFPQPSCLHL